MFLQKLREKAVQLPPEWISESPVAIAVADAAYVTTLPSQVEDSQPPRYNGGIGDSALSPAGGRHVEGSSPLDDVVKPTHHPISALDHQKRDDEPASSSLDCPLEQLRTMKKHGNVPNV